MSEPILKISQLTARVEEKEILHDINFEMRKGETHVLMGPNGAGKSTLGYVLMGNPKYEVTGGSISFKGKDITAENADKRAKDGMFLSFQEPLEVPGLSVSNFIRNALQQKKGGYVRLWDFKKELKKNLEFLDLDDSYAERSLNVGFSGGEKKKIETLQLMMLRPSLAILDETDSGLDVDAVRLVSKGVEEYQKDRDGALLDHHPQHEDPGVPACGLHPCHGKRPYCCHRRRFHGGRDQRKRIRALSEQCSGRR